MSAVNFSALRKDFDLSGQAAVVTGGGRGIGLAIAAGLGLAGARVLIAGRKEETLRTASDALSRQGVDCQWAQADVADEQSVLDLKREVMEKLGKATCLVNCAGINPHYAYLEDTSTDEWRRVLSVNLNGVFYCSRHIGGTMLETGGGSIINISSLAGSVALKRQTPYCASKGGVEQFTKALAFDWAERGVRVNAIAYGFVETDLTAGVRGHDSITQRFLARTPMARFGRLEETAAPAVFLASPGAAFVTGATIAVDGGWTSA